MPQRFICRSGGDCFMSTKKGGCGCGCGGGKKKEEKKTK
jgi:hypothetical protein